MFHGTRSWGVRRDTHDVRDFLYEGGLADEPQHVDLRAWAGPIKDQGEEGSCTGHAFSSAREWIARRYENTEPVLSPQFFYVEELIADNNFPKDEGSFPRTGCKVLTSMGVCESSLYPYVAGDIHKPNADQLRNALKYRTGAYHRLTSVADLENCLGDSVPWPVTVGVTVYESFESNEVAKTGIMPVPKPGEKVLGGHEVLCLGYDRLTKLALMQNSWSENWGQKGYFYMPYEVVGSPDTDLWMTHTGKPW